MSCVEPLLVLSLFCYSFCLASVCVEDGLQAIAIDEKNIFKTPHRRLSGVVYTRLLGVIMVDLALKRCNARVFTTVCHIPCDILPSVHSLLWQIQKGSVRLD